MKFQAAVSYAKHSPFVLEEVTSDPIDSHEVLVRIVGSGLCHTDVAARDGHVPVPCPVILGHEGSGIVEQVGAKVTKVVPGDHVVLTYAFCGTCRFCLAGKPAYCQQLLRLNFTDEGPVRSNVRNGKGESIHSHFFGQSSFASHTIAKECNVIKVRKDAPLELLGVLGCGVQTGAGAVMNVLQPWPGSSIIIFGVGPVGLSAVMAAKVCGCTTIIAADVLDSRLEAAREFGATHTIKITTGAKITEQILAIQKDGVERALDTSGRSENCIAGLESLSTLGMLGFLGVPHSERPIEVQMFNMLVKGQTLRGITEGDSVPEIYIPQLVDLYMAGQFPFDKMITRYNFNDINQAIEDQAAGKVVKAVFTF